jgi:transketolase
VATTRSGSPFTSCSGFATRRLHRRTPPPPAAPLPLLLNVTGGGLGRGIPNWLGLASGTRDASYRPRLVERTAR